MGDVSYIVEGKDNEESRSIFYSTVHGAGRIMSRSQAKGKVKLCKDKNSPDYGTYRVIKEGEVNKEMMMNWLEKVGVYLVGGDLDESPHVYKRLPSVINHHKNTLEIVCTLRPIGVAMAGEDIRR
jgi:tRNA-splicing ligase RtcB